MYRCEQCHEVVGPRVAQRRVVIETRVKRYPFREQVNVPRKRGRRAARLAWVDHAGGEETFREVVFPRRLGDDAGGAGREIVRELALCARCLELRL